MSGAPEELAKATVLALFDAARRQRRSFGLVLFDGTVRGTKFIERPRDATLDDVLGLIEAQASGGTDIAGALNRARDVLRQKRGPWKRADVLLVTDGECHRPHDSVDAVRDIQKMGASVYLLGIGATNRFIGEACDKSVNMSEALAGDKEGLQQVARLTRDI